MDYKEQLIQCKGDLSHLQKQKHLTEEKLEIINKQIETTKDNINRIERYLNQSLSNEDIKTKVYVYRYHYKYKLEDIAKLTNYSLVYVKKISAQISKELKEKQE